ncbi:MAG: prepilin-type N-terminal cleavage/methylation domain-containing protein [Methylococcaceae bacterium]|nr:prepilin-type N-terminal cleavage/methylation domain-containing protein [Methylococcaceae bacterium]
MKTADLIQTARTKKLESVLSFLKLAFNDFDYPVYLFGSYATGQFHGHSDVDILIISPDALSAHVYRQASDKMTGININYDILISPSINRLDSSIVNSLQAISATASCTLPPASMQSNVPDQPSNPLSRHQLGMTLIEIMIALLIGAFLLGGVLQIFIGTKQTYRMQEGLSRLQENGRFALDFLAKDIRMAGFIGCNSGASLTNTPVCITPDNPVGCTTPLKTPNTLNTPTGFLYDFKTSIQGFESTSATAWTPAIAADITSPLGGSDVIAIRRAADENFTVTAHASATADLTLDATATTANLKTAGFLKTDGSNNCATAVLSDCSAAAVFQVSAIAGTDLSHATGGSCTLKNSTDDLGKTYVGGQVYPINTISYYIRTNDSNQPSLYRKLGSNDAQELVEGIENMQILYGVDTDPTPDGAANYYVRANDAVANMAKVVSIRIILTARTIDGNLTATGDGRIRRNFASTIAVRNRLP